MNSTRPMARLGRYIGYAEYFNTKHGVEGTISPVTPLLPTNSTDIPSKPVDIPQNPTDVASRVINPPKVPNLISPPKV